jgi:membrane protease YdiL (CAAX protease family)
MSSGRLLALAFATQGFLVLVAWTCSRWLGISPRWGEPLRDTAIGLLFALVLAGANYLLLTRAPSNWLVDGVRAVYHEILKPLFSRLGVTSIIALGAAAGLGEEWLFRGVLQPLIGLAPTCAAFGLAHVGGVRMLPFGIWASGMGLVMGLLAIATGGLIAPMVAHGVYDMMALEYIRRGAHAE